MLATHLDTPTRHWLSRLRLPHRMISIVSLTVPAADADQGGRIQNPLRRSSLVIGRRVCSAKWMEIRIFGELS